MAYYSIKCKLRIMMPLNLRSWWSNKNSSSFFLSMQKNRHKQFYNFVGLSRRIKIHKDLQMSFPFQSLFFYRMYKPNRHLFKFSLLDSLLLTYNAVRPTTRGSEDRIKRRLENPRAMACFKGHQPFYMHNFCAQTNLDIHRTIKSNLERFC